MNAYEVSLEKFEGPLDLLIHLIQKNKIDIYDIPIAKITNQYLAHIQKWRELDMEVASEFVVMASRLLEIKSHMLLPRSDNIEEDEEDLREKLVQQLLEYQVFKNISLWMDERQQDGLRTLSKDPEYIPELVSNYAEIEITPEDLEKAYSRVFSAYDDNMQLRDYSREIEREVFTVEEKVAFIENQFKEQQTTRLHFSQLFSRRVSRSELVVTFLAILELYKINRICLLQDRVFQEIIIGLGNEYDAGKI